MSLNQIAENWDLIVVGGGITGAGIFREAVARGLRTLLLEKRDFAWGTSSRSSKLVHGGLRYLKQGQLGLTRDAVRERERLLREMPGLVTPIRFVMPLYTGRAPRRWEIKLGLTIYDLLAGHRQHRFLDRGQVMRHIPQLRRAELSGAYQFRDAQTDDARLVLRLIQDGVASGGAALNYTEAAEILRTPNGCVEGLRAAEIERDTTRRLHTRVVINATGVWAARLDPEAGRRLGIRPLRGSHLVLRREALPLDQAVSFLHPEDRRAVFVVPWEGVVLVGTTDLDHEADLDAEPSISPGEVKYLWVLLAHYFPGLAAQRGACVGTLAGLRPILGQDRTDPSRASREHAVRADRGLVTVTGGKLTTFQILARDALGAARAWLPKRTAAEAGPLIEIPAEKRPASVAEQLWRVLHGRYGAAAARLLAESDPGLLQPIEKTGWLWAELGYAARYESVQHLDDLLLRRVRLGLVCAQGGAALLDRVEAVCAPYLSWDKVRWQEERQRYTGICQRFFEPIDLGAA